MPVGEGAGLGGVGAGRGVEVAEREHHPVGEQHGVGEVDALRAVRVAGDPQRGVLVDEEPYVLREFGGGAAQRPVQVGGLGAPGREVGGQQGAQFVGDVGVGLRQVGRVGGRVGGPLGERGAGADRSVHGGALVGEHGDVLRHRVHPQQRGLRVAPDPAPAGRVRVDQVDVQPHAGAQQFGRVGGYPLQQAGAPRTGSHDDQHGHRAHRPTARRKAARARCHGVGGSPARVAPRAKCRSR